MAPTTSLLELDKVEETSRSSHLFSRNVAKLACHAQIHEQAARSHRGR
jgi:hypothetical protein